MATFNKRAWVNGQQPAINDTNLNALENDIQTFGNDIITEARNNVLPKLGYDQYSNTSPYSIGDCCIYDNKLYVCNTTISTAEEWDSSHWTETSLSELIALNANNISSIQSSLASQDFSGSVTFNEGSPANYMFRRSGKTIVISFRGQSKTHTGDNVIFTIPSGYRPANNVYAPFTKGGSAYGVLEIAASTGACRIVFISSTTSTDRLVCNITYMLPN